MLLPLPLLIGLLLLPHGGQYQLPLELTPPDGSGEAGETLVLAQPGQGPVVAFEASRWEWWFDFNEAELLDIKRRLPRRAGTRSHSPVTGADRLQRVLPVLVDSLRTDGAATAARIAGTEAVGIISTPNKRDVRASAAMALGRLQMSDAVPYIAYVAEGDPDLFVRTQATLALGVSGVPQATEVLARLYRDADVTEEIRVYAAVGLALDNSAYAVDVLHGSLTEKRLEAMPHQLRIGTLYAAGLCGNPLLGPPLRELSGSWLWRRQPEVRALAATALGGIQDPEAVPFLIDLLTESNNQVRRSAAEALAGNRVSLDDATARLLIHFYRNESDIAARINLAHALARAGTDESSRFLRGAFLDAPFMLRGHLALALGIDGAGENGAVLLDALDRARDTSMQGALSLALGLLGTSDAVAPVRELLATTGAPLVRGYAGVALGLLQPDGTEDGALLENLLTNEHDPETIRLLALGLALLGERERLDGLAAQLSTVASTLDRAAWAFSLGQASDRAALDPLLGVIEDARHPTYVRAYAIQALGEVSDPRFLSPLSRLTRHVSMDLDIGHLFELYGTL